MQKRVRVLISGRVQGVGFRYWVRSRAIELGLAGWVRNLADGKVEAVFEGDEVEVKKMIKKCYEGAGLSKVDKIERKAEKWQGEDDFDILK